MNTQTATVLLYGLYKLACIGVGLGIANMGYRLFLVQPLRPHETGEAKISFKSIVLMIKKTGPGGFFALFGTAIVVATVWQGFNITQNRDTPTPALPVVELPAEPPSG